MASMSRRVLAARILGTRLERRAFCTAPATVRPLHLLLYQYVDNALVARAPFRLNHLAATKAAAARGELLLGGALSDPVDGAVLVFTASQAAENFAESDPYVLNGVVTSWTVREWSVVVGAVALEPVPAFEPCYEWKRVESGAELPQGLEVELPLDGASHQRARIPPTWQLQVYVESGAGYVRCAVTRSTTVAELRATAAAHIGVAADCIVLQLAGRPLDDHETAESLRLLRRIPTMVGHRP